MNEPQRKDLLALLDYAQPDEERDYLIWREENPDVEDSAHIVHAIRRLRAWAEASQEPESLIEQSKQRPLTYEQRFPEAAAADDAEREREQ